ncbi:PTS lactose/cellobiose transporter subunit IIA [Mycoplasma marinum]|uniref:PTS lactose/cellobiose transporter subunit IIA n=1 Tax=Mycoplasma marinum TaxID=1937190 RepID=A0A4R0XMM1_9MOLU|nr:PTS lactose/cellobiose transporter subunit IIA [Mycoplasma marinum]TCG10712.1 PTS lactose/cellobiose transporter subunit IIA [Mycoplasma marinum]
MSDKKSKIDFERVSFEIITKAGGAKSSAMEALYLAKDKDYEAAAKKMKESNDEIAQASHAHMDVIVEEAQGVNHEFKVLFLHAEDQLLTTQTLILLVGEMIEMYKKFDK